MNEIEKAIQIIEEKTVYRNKSLTDKNGVFFAINDPEQELWEWSYKKILKLAEIAKNKPSSLL